MSRFTATVFVSSGLMVKSVIDTLSCAFAAPDNSSMAAAKSVSSGMRPRFPLYVLLLMSFCLIVVFLLLVCEEGAAASHGGHAFT